MAARPPPEDSQDPWSSLEPFAQLFRALLPRAASSAVFDAAGQLRWSSDATVGPDLVQLVDDLLPRARADDSTQGELRVLGDTQPVYLCWLRDERKELFAALAILYRGSPADTESRSFAFVHSLLRPALACLSRDLLARAAVADLRGCVSELDRDLELLLADAAEADTAADGADGLKLLIQKIVARLNCGMGALIVPEKSIALMHCAPGVKSDSHVIARTHRYLLQLAGSTAQPLIINQLDKVVADAAAYRVLVCPVRNANGRNMGVLALFRDPAASPFTERDGRVAEILARRAAAVIASHYDVLSGLYTRTAFEQRVRGILAERTAHNAQWSALYINCDRLHVINDAHGMHVGDLVIGQLGELIRGRLPPGALAARISGDRFTVLLPSSVDDASQFAESLRAGAQVLSTLHSDLNLSISISVGVAPLESGRGGELAHSLAAAETACKAAKDRGRNRVATYQPGDQSVMRRFADIDMVARVREALAHDRLRLDAQAIVPFNPASGKPVHYELLLRMIGGDGAAIGPASFLSAAVRYQMMSLIDRWVIRRTISLLKPHAARLQHRPFVISINFSGQSLSDEEFPDFLLHSVESSGLNPQLFCFELTENATILSLSRAEMVIRRLRRLGCGVALDDFGTGLCSLAYLRQLPVTMLKIDGSFVRDVVKDPRAESMVQIITQLARAMSLDTVAEYVETAEIRARIAAHGLDFGQGHAIGRTEAFEDLLARLGAPSGDAQSVPSPVSDPRAGPQFDDAELARPVLVSKAG